MRDTTIFTRSIALILALLLVLPGGFTAFAESDFDSDLQQAPTEASTQAQTTDATLLTSETHLISFTEDIRTDVITAYGGTITDELDATGIVIAELTQPTADLIASHPAINAVEEDHPVEIDNASSHTTTTRTYGHTTIRADIPRDVGLTGQGVKVSIIDTGVSTTHPDLTVTDGYNFLSNNSNYDDDNGHGSHVAGILAGTGDPAANGVRGVAPGVEIYAAKAMDSTGGGNHSTLVRAINWSIEKNVDIINLSLGSPRTSSVLEQAAQAATDRGILLVAAAGNFGSTTAGTTTVDFPARYSNVIAVAATDQQDNRANFSGYGPEVEIAAPGVRIYSADRNNTYRLRDGTSMATPYVTGMLAIMKQQDSTKTARQLRLQLRDWATPLGTSQPNSATGFGRIQFPTNLQGPLQGVLTVDAEVTARTTQQATVNITWTDRDRTQSVLYEVRRNGTVIYEGRNRSFQDTVRQNGDYTYAVRTKRNANTSAPVTKTIPVQLEDRELAPSQLTATLTTISKEEAVIEVIWTDDPRSQQVDYILRRNGQIIYTGMGTRFVDRVNADGDYTYDIRARRSPTNISEPRVATDLRIRLADQYAEILGRYSDVAENAWYLQYLGPLNQQNLIRGYQDNTIRPTQAITRAEVVTILARQQNWGAGTTTTTFSDLPATHFARGTIAEAARRGIISGYSDGTVRPNAPVTRGELAVFLSRAYSYPAVQPVGTYPDLRPQAFYTGSVNQLNAANIIGGYPDGTIRPDQAVTRAEFAAFLQRTLLQ
ncbi:S8 family serine peptidase [Paenalkalicoccus suaedae]|uniref:S8 family serine peptidase n=1 Tax=Paenalkalicoccus suaedae TaxID=2592382 RepID=A0A859FHX9_9BACI|nr:S8 family serine peptidase [Paenalkalicoccus suaedae]QKS72701.1 S8 family serine peptidase [Paenalkalicoccus suaedae]